MPTTAPTTLAGDLDEADRLVARVTAVGEQLRQPLMRWYASLMRANRCAISGHAQEAERLAFAALEVGRSAEQPDSMLWFVGQLFVARFLQGSLDRDDPHVLDVLKSLDSQRCPPAPRSRPAARCRSRSAPRSAPSSARSADWMTGAGTSSD